MIIDVEYGVGYGTHSTQIDVPYDMDSEQIAEEVADYVRERVWWSWTKEGEED